MSKKKRRQKGISGSGGGSAGKNAGSRDESRPSLPFRSLTLSFLRRNRRVVRSILLFGGCILVFMLVYSSITETKPMMALSRLIANITSFILNSLAFDTRVNAFSVTSADFSMTIAAACTAIVPMAIVVSAVIAYPSRLRDKSKGIALGIIGLFVINLGRMVGLFIVGTFVPDFFNIAHYVIGQSLMVILAIALWLFWEEKWVHGAAE